MVIIKNIDNNEILSDLLSHMAKIVVRENDDKILKITSFRVKGAKNAGDIISEIAIGLSTSAIYDLIKFCISKVNSRPEYDDSLVLRMDDINIKLKDFVDDKMHNEK